MTVKDGGRRCSSVNLIVKFPTVKKFAKLYRTTFSKGRKCLSQNKRNMELNPAVNNTLHPSASAVVINNHPCSQWNRRFKSLSGLLQHRGYVSKVFSRMKKSTNHNNNHFHHYHQKKISNREILKVVKQHQQLLRKNRVFEP